MGATYLLFERNKKAGKIIRASPPKTGNQHNGNVTIYVPSFVKELLVILVSRFVTERQTDGTQKRMK